jgi:hypothetical protein
MKIVYRENKYKLISWKSKKQPGLWYTIEPFKIKVVIPKKIYDDIKKSTTQHNLGGDFNFEIFVDNRLFKIDSKVYSMSVSSILDKGHNVISVMDIGIINKSECDKILLRDYLLSEII